MVKTFNLRRGRQDWQAPLFASDDPAGLLPSARIKHRSKYRALMEIIEPARSSATFHLALPDDELFLAQSSIQAIDQDPGAGVRKRRLIRCLNLKLHSRTFDAIPPRQRHPQPSPSAFWRFTGGAYDRSYSAGRSFVVVNPQQFDKICHRIDCIGKVVSNLASFRHADHPQHKTRRQRPRHVYPTRANLILGATPTSSNNHSFRRIRSLRRVEARLNWIVRK
jgi:hypothetical protein